MSFGYTRTDTCSFCDQCHITFEFLEIELKESKDAQ